MFGGRTPDGRNALELGHRLESSGLGSSTKNGSATWPLAIQLKGGFEALIWCLVGAWLAPGSASQNTPRGGQWRLDSALTSQSSRSIAKFGLRRIGRGPECAFMALRGASWRFVANHGFCIRCRSPTWRFAAFHVPSWRFVSLVSFHDDSRHRARFLGQHLCDFTAFRGASWRFVSLAISADCEMAIRVTSCDLLDAVPSIAIPSHPVPGDRCQHGDYSIRSRLMQLLVGLDIGYGQTKIAWSKDLAPAHTEVHSFGCARWKAASPRQRGKIGFPNFGCRARLGV